MPLFRPSFSLSYKFKISNNGTTYQHKSFNMPRLPFSKTNNDNKNANEKKASSKSIRRQSSKTSASATASLTSSSDHATMEQSRRASMASSIADSVDYQPQQDSSVPASPAVRRSSGPTSTTTTRLLNTPSTYPKQLLEREDSWGCLSLEGVL